MKATVAGDSPIEAPNPADRSARRTFFGEPPALGYLVFTEAWERFSYYGMSSLMVLYMTEALFVPGRTVDVLGFTGFKAGLEQLTGPLSIQALASMVYGLYSGLVYFVPVAGGLVADRWLGRRATVVLGCLLLCAGHIAMAFTATFLVALCLIISGSGCIKGNISAQVGQLYDQGQRGDRTRGFTFFTIGINVGGFAGPLFCGLLAQVYGWHVGFSLAAILMLVSLAVYLAGLRHLPQNAQTEEVELSGPLTRADWGRIALILAILVITTTQQVAYHQMSNVGLVWIRQNVDLATPWGKIPVPWYVALDGLSYVVLSIPLFAFWRWQARRRKLPSAYTKMAIGSIVAALSSGALAVGSMSAPPGQISVLWPIATNLGMSIATLYLWPTLLALVSQNAPAQAKSTMLGVVYLSLFAGNLIMGWIGTFYADMSHQAFWSLHAGIASAGAVVLFATRRSIEDHLSRG